MSVPPRKKILFLFPTPWDARQLESCRDRWKDRFDVSFGEPSDWDCPWDLDAILYVESQVAEWRGKIDGVLSSSDYPGATLAGALATQLGLPGTAPATLVGCAHKYHARLVHRKVAPEATPAFALLDGAAVRDGTCDVDFPCFVKPVKGAYSVLARRIHGPDELRAFLASPPVPEFCGGFLHIFDQMVRGFTDLHHDGHYFLAESILEGAQVTVEGFCRGEEVRILGITDSVVDAPTGSFLRFVFPSTLDAGVQERMGAIAGRVVRGLGLVAGFFNIEMRYDAAGDRIGIIEVNPRLCGQFGDLYQKVLGCNSYELALELAAGGEVGLPPAASGQVREPPGAGRHAVAASFPLRVFRPVRVSRAPAAADIAAAEALFPGTMIWNECNSGQELADFDTIEDGASCRYAVVNLGAPDRESLDARLAAVQERLQYRFEPL